MTEQELIDRLRLSLDTLENDAEIANAVRRIRRARGRGAFAEAKPAEQRDRLLLGDQRGDVLAGMRQLAFIMKSMQRHGIAQSKLMAVARVEAAITLGAQWVEGADVRATLAALAELLNWLRASYNNLSHEADRYRDMVLAMANPRSDDLERMRQQQTAQAAQAQNAWSGTTNSARNSPYDLPHNDLGKRSAEMNRDLRDAMMNLAERTRRAL